MENLLTILFDFKKHKWLGNFAWKAIVCTRKVCLFTKGKGRNFLKWEKMNIRIKILIWRMVGEMVKNRVGQDFLSCNYFCMLYFFVDMLEFTLWHNKTETKNAKAAKTVEFIKTCDQCSRKINFGHVFTSIILPFFCWEENKFSENAGWNG